MVRASDSCQDSDSFLCSLGIDVWWEPCCVLWWKHSSLWTKALKLSGSRVVKIRSTNSESESLGVIVSEAIPSYEGGAKTLGFIYKKLCIYSYMFKLQSPSKYGPCDATHLLRLFSHCSKQFWTRWFGCFLVLLPFFVSPLPHWQNVSHWGLCSFRETKKVTWGEIGWIGRVGHGGHAVFGQKLLNTQCGVGRCTCKSPIMKCANTLKESSKKLHWSQMQPLTTMPADTLIQMGS